MFFLVEHILMRIIPTIDRAGLKKIIKIYNKKVRYRELHGDQIQVMGQISKMTRVPWSGEFTICISDVVKVTTRDLVADHLWIVCEAHKHGQYEIGQVIVVHGSIKSYGKGKKGLYNVHTRHALDEELNYV